MMKRIAVLPVLLLLAFPAVAGATIIINRGMFGVNLGDTAKQVRQKLGGPTIVNHIRGETSWFYYYRDVLIAFSGKHRVREVYTESRTERTASGVGVGSRERDVKRLVHGVRCSTIPGEAGASCDVTNLRARVATSFDIGDNGRVSDVIIEKG